MSIRRALTRLLPAAAVLGLLATAVVLVLRGADPAPHDDARARAAAERPHRTAPLPGHRVAATIGVVSQNIWHDQDRAGTRHDLDRITRNPAVDIIGWQESAAVGGSVPSSRTTGHFLSLYPRYRDRGWETAYFLEKQGSREAAISWRTSVFRLLSTDAWKMHEGAGRPETDRAFAGRFVTSALLEHRDTGLTVRIVNSHVVHGIETGQEFTRRLNARVAKRHIAWLADHWNTLSGDVVVGTGDYNWDFRDDHDARPAGGITRQFAGEAVSSYQALGTTGVIPTLGTRWIDYVFVSADDVIAQRAQFATHRSLSGFRADHRPLLSRIRLYR